MEAVCSLRTRPQGNREIAFGWKQAGRRARVGAEVGSLRVGERPVLTGGGGGWSSSSCYRAPVLWGVKCLGGTVQEAEGERGALSGRESKEQKVRGGALWCPVTFSPLGPAPLFLTPFPRTKD